MKHVRIELPILLPEIPDARDACVRRLQELLNQRRGITKTHVVEDNGATLLCLHYDPDVITLDKVQRLAEAAGAEVRERYGHRVWPIRAVAAEDAGRRIEDTLMAIDGVLAVSANLAGQVVRVEFERARLRPENIDEALRAGGLAAAAEADARGSWFARNRELAWSLAAGALLSVGLSLARAGVAPSVVVPIYLGSYAFGAFDLVSHAFEGLRKGRFAFDIDLLMLLAAVGAAVLGEWAEGAFLLFLFSLAHALEHYALGRARASIRALADLAPSVARVQRGDRLEDVPVADVQKGERVLVRPAERVPVDGRTLPGAPRSTRRPSRVNRFRWTRARETMSSLAPSMAKER
jgi:Zn2+/Cd2+-exporting ATPase